MEVFKKKLAFKASCPLHIFYVSNYANEKIINKILLNVR
jgi:hypothetical protein